MTTTGRTWTWDERYGKEKADEMRKASAERCRARAGKPISEEHRKSIIEAKRELFREGNEEGELTRKRMADAKRGSTQTPEHVAKRAAAIKATLAQKRTGPK